MPVIVVANPKGGWANPLSPRRLPGFSPVKAIRSCWVTLIGRNRPGCGFPQARICACFCLQSGALLSYRVGHKKNHELPLLRKHPTAPPMKLRAFMLLA